MADGVLTSQEHLRRQPECIGKTQFTGKLFHGTALKTGIPIEQQLPKLGYQYRNHFIRPSSDLEVSGVIGDTSFTLGPALYATTEKASRDYANLRGRSPNGRKTPGLIELNLEDAAFFDFRRKDNSNLNAGVPQEMAKSWNDYYSENRSLIEKRFNDLRSRHSQNGIQDVVQILNEYQEFLGESLLRYQTGERYPDIRELLNTTLLGRRINLDPIYGGLWVSFVIDKLKCDGIVVMEGGEGFDPSPSYAIYNLDVIKSQSINKVN